MTTPKIAAEFSEVRPKTDQGRIRVAGSGTAGTINLGTAADTLENGTIQIVSPLNAFKPGQQIMFWLSVYNGSFGGSGTYIDRVRLKPWWLRPNNEFRSPGSDPGVGDLGLLNAPAYSSNPEGWKTVDDQTFGGGTYVNNRACWFPGVKMADVTEFQTSNPPPAAPARQSDSLMLDELWTLDLQDPFSGAAQALPLRPVAPVLGAQQKLIGRSVVFMYVARGYALGLTHAFTTTGGQGTPALRIDLTWVTGTL